MVVALCLLWGFLASLQDGDRLFPAGLRRVVMKLADRPRESTNPRASMPTASRDLSTGRFGRGRVLAYTFAPPWGTQQGDEPRSPHDRPNHWRVQAGTWEDGKRDTASRVADQAAWQSVEMDVGIRLCPLDCSVENGVVWSIKKRPGGSYVSWDSEAPRRL